MYLLTFAVTNVENMMVGKQVGVTANCDRSKELSSVQNFSSNHSWSALNKVCLHLRTFLSCIVEPAGGRFRDFELDMSFIFIA